MFNSIFQKPWWLDAVAPKQWGCVEVKRNNTVVAKMPFCLTKKHGFTYMAQPELTQTLGPYIVDDNSLKYCNKLAYEKDLMFELIQQLPKFDYFHQQFHHSITNWIPFSWNGFDQTTRYTYILDDLSDLDKVWFNFQANIKSDIKKAQKKVVVRSDLGLDVFYEVVKKTFTRQGKFVPYSYDFLKRVNDACVSNNASQMYFAEDAEHRVHSAVYVVWDENSAYYLIGGADPELRNSGANSLLLWEAIKNSSNLTKKFDFEGSMIEPVERFFRGFGSKQVPYFSVTKVNSKTLKIYNSAKDILRTLLC